MSWKIIATALAFATASAGTAHANLILNGGFETGDFSSWTQGGLTSTTGVDSSVVHSGTFAAALGPVGAHGTLSQTFATTIGTKYQFSFWLQHDGGTPNFFDAFFNAVSVSSPFPMNDVGAQGYTQYVFNGIATGVSTAIQFEFQQDPLYWHLDDVSVVACQNTGGEGCVPVVETPEPGTLGLLGTGVLAALVLRRRKKRV